MQTHPENKFMKKATASTNISIFTLDLFLANVKSLLCKILLREETVIHCQMAWIYQKFRLKGGQVNVCIGLPRCLRGKESCLQTQQIKETQDHSLGREEPLEEEEIATYYSILACKIPRQRNLACYSPWGHKRIRHD